MNRKILNYILIAIGFFLLIFSSFLFLNNKTNKNNDFLEKKSSNIYKFKKQENKIFKLKNNYISDNINNFKQENKKKNNEIKIFIGGDVMLSRAVGYFNKKDGYERILKKYNPVSQTGGLVFLNLESPFSNFPKDTFSSSYYFGSGTGNIEVLKKLKGNNKMIVSLANNHIRNSLREGIETTIKLLDKTKIYYSGVGYKNDNYRNFIKIKINNNLVCLQAFSYDGGNYKYVFVNRINQKEIKETLDLMKKQNCDLNLISLHWGSEYKFEPTKKQVKLAHYLIDNGADMLIGHHSHIFGKTEIYKNKPIFYSLGNFIFDQDLLVNNCNKYVSCIYDKKLKKKIRPVNIGVAYELKFEKHKLISKIQKKHRISHYGELTKF